MGERITVETPISAQLEANGNSNTDFKSESVGVSPHISSSPLSVAYDRTPQIERTVATLHKIGTTSGRQKALSSLGKKYGNSYLARVVAGYQNNASWTPAANVAPTAESATVTNTNRNEPLNYAPKASPESSGTSASSLATSDTKLASEPKLAPNASAVNTPDSTVSSNTSAISTLGGAVSKEGVSNENVGNVPVAGGGDDDNNGKSTDQNKTGNTSANKEQTVATGRVQQRSETPAQVASDSATPVQAKSAVQRTLAPVPDKPIPTPTPTAEQDPNLQALKQTLTATKETQKTHDEIETKVVTAQNAATAPQGEVESHAEANKVEQMDAAEQGEFNRENFEAQVETSINGVTINPENDLRQMLDSPDPSLQTALTAIETNVETEQETAKTDIQTSTDNPLDTSTNVPLPDTGVPTQSTTYTPEEAGTEPAIPVTGIAPNNPTDVATTLSYGPTYIEDQIAGTEVFSAEQFQGVLDNGESLDFPAATTAKTAKDNLDQDVADASQTITDYQTANIDTPFQTTLQGTVDVGVGQAHSGRSTTFTEASTKQQQVKGDSEIQRQTITDRLNGIYTRTENLVRPILDGLRQKALDKFNEIEAGARETFVSTVFDRVVANRDAWGFGGRTFRRHELIADNDRAYTEEREVYKNALKTGSDAISQLVHDELALAKQHITDGKTEIETYIASLPNAGLQQIARDATTDLNTRFDSLSSEIDAKYSEMEILLDEQFNNAVADLDAFIQEVIDANKNLLDDASEAVTDVINTINEMKDLLTRTLQKGLEVIGKILENPEQFLNNLIAVAEGGVQQFVDNIDTHLVSGLQEWLFGNLSDGGIELPATLDLQGALDIALQVMGIDYDFIRVRAVTVVDALVPGKGEAIVAKVEQVVRQGVEIIENENVRAAVGQAIELFDALRTGGLEGLIEELSNDITDFATALQDAVIGWVQDQLPSAIATIASWFVPGAGFIQACEAIVNTIQQIIDNAQRIMTFVNSILDTIEQIANGEQPEGLLGMIEDQLAQALSLTMDFLLDLACRELGINLPQLIQNAIKSIQDRVETGVDAVLNRLLSFLGDSANADALDSIGGATGEVDVAQVTAAINDAQTTDRTTTYEDKRIITNRAADAAAATALQDSRCQTSLDSLRIEQAAGATWDYTYSSSGQVGIIPGLARAEIVLEGIETKGEEARNAIELAKQAIRNAQSMSDGKTELADFRADLVTKLARLEETDGDVKLMLDEADALFQTESQAEVLTVENLEKLDQDYTTVKEAADLMAAESVPVDDELIALFGTGPAATTKAREAMRLFNNDRAKLVEAMDWFSNFFDEEIKPRINLVNGNITRFHTIISVNFAGDAENMMRLEGDLECDFGQLAAVMSMAALNNNAVATTEFATFVRDTTLNVPVEGEVVYANPAMQVYHRWRNSKDGDEVMVSFGLDPANTQDRTRFTTLRRAYEPLGGIPKLRTAYNNFTSNFTHLEESFTGFTSNAQNLEDALDDTNRSGLTVRRLLEAWDNNGARVTQVLTGFTGTPSATTLVLILNQLKTGANYAGTGAMLDAILQTANAEANIATFSNFMQLNLENDYKGLHNLITRNLLPAANYSAFATWVVEGKTKVLLENNQWGSDPNKPSEDAYFSLLQYDLAKNGSGTALLGNYSLPGISNNSTGIFMQYSDVWVGSVAGTPLALTVLDLGGRPSWSVTWSINVNFSWLQGNIDVPGRFLVIADVNNDRNRAQNPSDPMSAASSVTARELAYLASKGFRANSTRADAKLYISPTTIYYYQVTYEVVYADGNNTRPIQQLVEVPQRVEGMDLTADTSGSRPTARGFSVATGLPEAILNLANATGQNPATTRDTAQTEAQAQGRSVTDLIVRVDPWGTNAPSFLEYVRS